MDGSLVYFEHWNIDYRQQIRELPDPITIKNPITIMSNQSEGDSTYQSIIYRNDGRRILFPFIPMI